MLASRRLIGPPPVGLPAARQGASLSDSLQRAAQIMWEGDCGVVPVVDDQNHVVGMITDRDITMAAYTRGTPLWQIPVSSAMAKQVSGASCR